LYPPMLTPFPYTTLFRSFIHLSQRYGAEALGDSLTHDGSGAPPGQKYHGSWDRRPHRDRAVRVDRRTLTTWQRLRSETDLPVDEDRKSTRLNSSHGSNSY